MATISGMWQFKETPTRPVGYITSDGSWVYVNFKCQGVQYDRFGVSGENDTVFPSIEYRDDFDREDTAYWFTTTDLTTKGWVSARYRTIYFGETPQIIEDSAYSWFTLNAKQLNTATIKGTWFFDETLKTPDTIFGGDKLISESVNFTCRPVNYLMSEEHISMFVDDFYSADIMDLHYGTTKVYDGDTKTWSDGAYRRLDFGDEDQTVSKDFYNWFTDNATEWACTIVEGVRNDASLYISGDEGIVLSCEEKIFKNDIVAKGIASVYFGDTLIKNASSNKKLVAKCKDAKARSDITIRATDCISFVIVDTEGKNPKRFVARQGMTWRELADSNYIKSVNPFGSYYISVQDYAVDDDEVLLNYDVTVGGHAKVETKVDDMLLENHVYRHGTFSNMGGSN